MVCRLPSQEHQQLLAGSCRWVPQLLPSTLSRALRTSPWAQASMDVKVPQMGESVTEGTIAAILKKPGA